MLNKYFKLQENKTTVKTEIIAGFTTFMAMAYILFVNPAILKDCGMPFNAVFLASAISACIASIIMGLVANYPIAQAPGMGINAFFAYTVCMQYGYTWKAALAGVFISGLLFLLISITGIRKKIINSIPKNLKLAIGAGIGFFIAFIGLKNAEIIVSSPDTFVTLGRISNPSVLLAIFGLAITLYLITKKVSSAVFWGLIATAFVGIICGIVGVQEMPTLPSTIISFDLELPTFMAFLDGIPELFSKSSWVMVLFSFLFVDFFDTAGTLVATGNDIGLVDEQGEIKGVEKALLSDSIGTVIGAMLGTSNVTSFVESTSGVAAGGRTGLTAVVTGLLFALAIFFSPLLSVVTGSVTAPALIVVGILMTQQLKGVEWDEFEAAAASFITMIMMILTYSISDGIALGFLTYTLCCIGSKKSKQIKLIIWFLDVIFIIYFLTR